jgi:monomeric sarcosine oxidase
MNYDVLVLGGGVVGAATAYALQRQGQRVALFEQFEPGHTRGSSHGDGRIVRFNYSEAIYVEMALLGYPAWERLTQAAGRELKQQTGLIEYGPRHSPPIEASESHLRQFGLPYERLTPNEAMQRFPQFHFAEDATVLYQAAGGVAFASPTVLALWRLFQDSGGTAMSGQRIDRIEIETDGVILHSRDQRWRGRNLVLAAGGWSAQLAAALELHLPIEVTQEVLAYFPSQDGSVDHHVGVMPAMIDYHDQERQFYCLPQVEIPGVKVGWHHSGLVVDADQRGPRPDWIVAGMQDWIRLVFPHLAPAPIEVLDCLYSNTPDYHFILDRHPRFEHVVIGAGFSGHGFKFGPIVGEILADLVLGKEPPLNLPTFALARFDQPDRLQRRSGA